MSGTSLASEEMTEPNCMSSSVICHGHFCCPPSSQGDRKSGALCTEPLASERTTDRTADYGKQLSLPSVQVDGDCEVSELIVEMLHCALSECQGFRVSAASGNVSSSVHDGIGRIAREAAAESVCTIF